MFDESESLDYLIAVSLPMKRPFRTHIFTTPDTHGCAMG
jgi:hypothetical protein